jgi:hypothetical protein
MVTGPAGASVDVLARKAFLNPACQNEVGLVAVVPGVLRLKPRRPLPDGRLSDHLAVSELIPRQINFHASRKPIPHVRFRSLAVAEDVRRQDFSAKDVVQDQRRNVALPARGIARRPSIVLVRRIETPAGSDGAFDLSERVHRTRVPTSGDIHERWPRRRFLQHRHDCRRNGVEPTTRREAACAQAERSWSGRRGGALPTGGKTPEAPGMWSTACEARAP